MSAEYLNSYRPTFTRALLWYANNGFFARDLDADDVAFIEGVRQHGNVACGSLAHAQSAPTMSTYDFVGHTVLEEELEYWRAPFELERGVKRRRFNKALLSAEQEKQRQARREQLRQIREMREQDRAAEVAELARELELWEVQQRALAEERARRIEQTKQSDLEWEAAERRVRVKPEPKKMPDLRNRNGPFYVPQWKIDEAWSLDKERSAEHAAAL